MEVTAGLIYVITMLEKLKETMALFAGLSVAVGVFSLVCCLILETERFKPWAKWSLITCVLLLILNVFVPSGKTLAAMYVIPPIANSDAVQKLPAEIVDVARDWLDALRPEKEKKEETK